MNRFFINLIIIITAFTNIQAQHPRVCDYVSLKHALKNREFEVMRSGPYQKDTMVVEHTKEEIRIGAINEYGKTIDSLNIINKRNCNTKIETVKIINFTTMMFLWAVLQIHSLA